MRPIGGALADRHGGARVTSFAFAAMMVGGAIIVAASLSHTLWLFIAGFVALFVLTGIGNGSVYKMIPTIFRTQAQAAAAAGGDAAELDRIAKRRSRALIGLTGSIGSFGGVLVNLALRQSFLSTGSGTWAYATCIAYYALCLGVTWRVYLRPSATTIGV